MTTLIQRTKTKADLVNQISIALGIPKSDSKIIVDLQFEIMSKFLEEGIALKITGLGKFSVLEKKPRLGRNPKTKEEALITARKVVSFRASQKMNRRLAKNSSFFDNLLEESTSGSY